MENTIWFIIAYAVGTAFGYFLGFTSNATRIATITVDTLIKDGYIKYRMLPNGEYDILKINETTEDENKD